MALDPSRDSINGAGGGTGTVQTVNSPDGSIVVAGGSGPNVNLVVARQFAEYDFNCNTFQDASTAPQVIDSTGEQVYSENISLPGSPTNVRADPDNYIVVNLALGLWAGAGTLQLTDNVGSVFAPIPNGTVNVSLEYRLTDPTLPLTLNAVTSDGTTTVSLTYIIMAQPVHEIIVPSPTPTVWLFAQALGISTLFLITNTGLQVYRQILSINVGPFYNSTYSLGSPLVVIPIMAFAGDNAWAGFLPAPGTSRQGISGLGMTYSFIPFCENGRLFYEIT